MPTKAVFILALSCGFSASTAADQRLETVLTDEYHDKVLALRHSFKPDRQEYAADGTPVKAAEEGPWTIYGRMVVSKITVDTQQLRVEGKRALFFFDSGGHPVQVKTDRKHPAEDLRVTVRLQQPLASVDEARTVLSRVFAFSPVDMVDSVPDYWRGHLAKQLGVEVPRKVGSEHASGAVEAGGIKSPADFEKMHIEWPRALHSPEPDYSDVARKWHVQGVVGLNIIVDPTGKVRDIKLVHPLGMGLDESAMATVGTWRFAPAKRDGQPVPVAIYVEVDFHLY